MRTICLLFALFFASLNSMYAHSETDTSSIKHSNSKETSVFPAKGKVKITGEKRKWHTITLNIEGPFAKETDTNPNPFLDYRLQATFTNGSKKYVVPGYFAADGNAGETSASEGNIWKVHFTPDLEGTWTYIIEFTRGEKIAVNKNVKGTSVKSVDGKRGTFKILPTNKTGKDLRAKGRLSYIGEHYLQFEETKEIFVKGGPDAPENLLAYQDFDGGFKSDGIADQRIKTFTPHIKDWKEGDPIWQNGKGKGLIGAINYLASKGLNTFSFLTFNSGGDDKNVFPYNEERGYTSFDVSKLDQWEIIFNHGQKLGFHLHFKTQENENDQFLDGGEVGIHRKLYYRELIARFSHHLALNWNLGEEITQTVPQQQAMAQYFYDHDPYAHNIVIHSFPEQQDKVYPPLLGDQSKLTGASIQTDWKRVHKDTKRWRQRSAATGHKWVVANDEQGSADIGVPEDAYPGEPNLHDIRKKVLWGNLMAGGAGVEYYFGYKRPESDLNLQNFRSRDKSWTYVSHAIQFMEKQSLLEMKPLENFSDKGWAIGKPGNEYLVYLPNGGNAKVNIPNNEVYLVEWFDPRNGGSVKKTEISRISKKMNGSNQIYLGNPPNNFEQDWVVKIYKEDLTNVNSIKSKKVNKTCGTSEVFLTKDFEMNKGFYAHTLEGREIFGVIPKEKPVKAEAAFTFKNASCTYNLVLHTVGENDGQSNFSIYVNNQLIRTEQTPLATQTFEFGSAYYLQFKNIALKTNDQIKVVAETNSKDGKEWSRARWYKLEVQTLNHKRKTEKIFEEQDGQLVIEAENTKLNKYWEVTNSFPQKGTGAGHIEFIGEDTFAYANVETELVYKIKINNPGTYQFKWRSRNGKGAEKFDQENDSWLNIQAKEFYGILDDKKVDLGRGEFIKVWVQQKDWSFDVKGEAHGDNGFLIFATYDKPGIYKIRVRGRSKHHPIDRMVMFKAEQSKQIENPSIAESSLND